MSVDKVDVTSVVSTTKYTGSVATLYMSY